MFDAASGIILSGSGLVSHDKVGTTPNAELPLVTAQGIEESLTMRTRPPSSQTISSQQSHSRSTMQLSLQIELISHMHIWGTERLRPWIEVSYLSHHHSLRHQGCFRAGTTSIEAYLLSMGHGSCALYDYTWNIRNTYTKYFIEST